MVAQDNWQIVKDIPLLQELAAAGLITLHENTGKEIQEYEEPHICYYLGAEPPSQFTYKNRTYRPLHAIGAFYPFLSVKS